MLLDHGRELRILGQEPDAGMNGVGAGDGGCRNDRRHVEIGIARRRRADADGFVGEPHMHGIGIGRRMHGHGADTHLAAGAVDAQRDFAAIGDEDFFKHRRG